MRKARDLSSFKFGLWTVVRRTNTRQPAKWLCRCDCGNSREVWDADLIRGRSKSCGCIARELAAAKNRTHGMTKTREYVCWLHIIQRCENENNDGFDNYGGRGIQICSEWRSDFSKFFQHIGPSPGPGFSVDRINNSKGYEPGNVRWATQEQQCNNMRRNARYAYLGEQLTVRQILKRSGVSIPLERLRWRLIHKWPVEKALSVPLDERRSLNARGRSQR